MMGGFLAAMMGGLITIAGTLAGKVLIGLGISVVTFTGITMTTDYLRDQVVANLGAMPASIVGMLALMKVGTCVNMMITAVTVRAGLEGLVGDTLKKWVGV